MSKKKSRNFSSNKLIVIILIAVVAMALVGCGVGYYLNSTKMEEISTEDDLIVNLSTKYFRGTNSCIDYNQGLLSDGTVSSKDLSYDTKEQIVIEYAIAKGYDKIGLKELRELYTLLFNDGSSLQEKLYYESTGGTYERDGDIYRATIYPSCEAAMPSELMCLVIDKAYKSDRNVKVVVGVFSGTAEDGKLYSGLDWNSESFGIYGEVDPAEQDLAKWEIVYKYNDKLGHYFFDYTRKL